MGKIGGCQYVEEYRYFGLGFETNMTLKERIRIDEDKDYEPSRYECPGVDAEEPEEASYHSYLMPVEEAIESLRWGVSGDVMRKGWEAIQLRREMEDGP